MKSLFSTLLFGGILLCLVAGCKKETAVPLPVPMPAPDPLTELSVARTKLMVGTWRTIALGPDLNKNLKLDSNESNPQLAIYWELSDYKADGSGLFRTVNSASNDSTFSSSTFRWYLSNNGENIIVISAQDSTNANIRKLTDNTFEWHRKTVATDWFGFCTR